MEKAGKRGDCNVELRLIRLLKIDKIDKIDY